MRTRPLSIARLLALSLLGALCLALLVPLGVAGRPRSRRGPPRPPAPRNPCTTSRSSTRRPAGRQGAAARSGTPPTAARTWTAQTSGTTQTLYGVAFVDANNGWAVAAEGPSCGPPTAAPPGAAADVGHDADALRRSRSSTPATAGRWAAAGRSCAPPTAAPPGAAADVGHDADALRASPSSTPATAGRWAAEGRRSGTPPNGGATWTAAEPRARTENALYARSAFGDASNGWRGRRQAARSATPRNGGASWSAQSSGTRQTLYGASPSRNADVGWAVGAGGTIRAHDATAARPGRGGDLRARRSTTCASPAPRRPLGGGRRRHDPHVSPDSPHRHDDRRDCRRTTTRGGPEEPVASPWRRATATAPAWRAIYYTVDGGGQQTYADAFTSRARAALDDLLVGRQGGQRRGMHSGYVNIDLAPPTMGNDATAPGTQRRVRAPPPPMQAAAESPQQYPSRPTPAPSPSRAPASTR